MIVKMIIKVLISLLIKEKKLIFLKWMILRIKLLKAQNQKMNMEIKEKAKVIYLKKWSKLSILVEVMKMNKMSRKKKKRQEKNVLKK